MFKSSTVGTAASMGRGQSGAMQPAAGGAERPAKVVGGSAGSPSNTSLPNFAVGAVASLPNAKKSAFKFQQLHLGFDTAEWSFSFSDAELESFLPVIDALVGQGEQEESGRFFTVSRIGGFVWAYKMAFRGGIEVRLPRLGLARNGVRVSAHSKVWLVSESPEDDVVSLLAWLTFLDPADLRARMLLARVDVCLDVLMPDREFQRISSLVARNDQQVVTRAHHKMPYIEGDRYTGFAVGKGAIRLRFYDKGAEAVQGGDWELWSKVYGQGAAFELQEGFVVARLEYQLRGEFLRECECSDLAHGVCTLADFRSIAPSVLAYLAIEWFRIAAPARGHLHERATRVYWGELAGFFVHGSWASFSGSFRRVLKRCVTTNVQRLADMAAGCLATLAAVLGHKNELSGPADMRAGLEYLRLHIRQNVDKFESGADRRYRALSYASGAWRTVAL